MTLDHALLLLFLIMKSQRIYKREYGLMVEAIDGKDQERIDMHRNRMTMHCNRVVRFNEKLQAAAL